jgi:hypothetical protein
MLNHWMLKNRPRTFEKKESKVDSKCHTHIVHGGGHEVSVDEMAVAWNPLRVLAAELYVYAIVYVFMYMYMYMCMCMCMCMCM